MNRKSDYAALTAVLLPLLCYVVCILAISNMQGESFSEVNIFGLQKDTMLIKLFLRPAVILGGLLGLFISPGLAWFTAFNKKATTGLETFIYAFLISLILLQAIVFGLRNICLAGVGRFEFITALFAVTALGGIFGLCKRRCFHAAGLRKPKIDEIAIFVTFIFVVALLFISMYDKIFTEDLNNDGHEIFWHSFHLVKALPYTNIPELAYLKPIPAMSFIILFGKAVASLRVPFFFYLALIYIVCLSIIYEGQKNKGKIPCFILAGHLVLFTIFMFFQPYSEPYHVDVATLIADILFLLLALCSAYALIKKRNTIFLIAVLLLLQCVHYALVMLIFIIAGYWAFFKDERRAIKSLSLRLMILLAAGAVLFLLHSRQFGYLKSWPQAINAELLSNFSRAGFTISPLDFMAKYGLLVGGLPVFMMLPFWRNDRISNFINFIALAYFLVLMMIAHKNVHTLTPIALLPVIGFLRLTYLADKNNTWLKSLRISHLFILIMCIVLLWPLSYQPHTERRDFWSKVQFIYPKDIIYIDDYVEDDIGRIFSQERLSHVFSGSWELYSYISNSLSPDYDYYFTDNLDNLNLSKSGLKIFSSYNGVFFLVRNLSDVKLWREKTIKTVDQRYMNLFRLMNRSLNK